MSLLDFIFPRRCFGCEKPGQYFCADCRKQLVFPKPVCPICQRPAVFGQIHSRCQTKYGLDGLSAFFNYQGLMQKVIKELKYRGVTDQVEELVSFCNQRWLKGLGRDYPRLEKEWVLVPVPLSSRRMRQRGFNQAALIGELLAAKRGWRFAEVLVRFKNTRPQSVLTAAERADNVRGIFQVKKEARLRSKKIVLFDDIWSSGSTLKECARVLKKRGASQVWGLVLAK